MENLPPIEVNEKENKFEMKFPNGEVAHLDYCLYNSNQYDLTHTFVPTSQRGKNIADHLSNFAMNHIKEKNGKALLSCSYLQDKWLPKNPEYIKYIIRIIKK